jgi:hypothetical protein
MQSPFPIQLGFPVAARGGARAARAPALSPEEERSLLGQGLGLVQYLGETLDKPGAALRGLVAGRPDQLWNLLPGSDYLGITHPDDRTSGRDLLEMAGILSPNKPGLFNSWSDAAGDVAGFGAEVLLDPLMLISGPGKALTKTGLAAAKGTEKLATKGAQLGKAAEQFASQLDVADDVAGAVSKVGRVMGGTPATRAQQIAAGERSLLKLGIPGTSIATTLGTTGPTAAKAYEALWYKNPLALALRGALSPTAGGTFSGVAQKALDIKADKIRAYTDAYTNLTPALRARGADMRSLLGDIAQSHRAKGDLDMQRVFDTLVRDLGETPYSKDLPFSPEHVEAAVRDLVFSGAGPEVWDATGEQFMRGLHEYIETSLAVKDDIARRAKDLGVNVQQLTDDYAEHVMRYTSNKQLKAQSKQGRRDLMERVFTGSQTIGRRDVLKNWPGRTRQINEVARNPLITGTSGLKGQELAAIKSALRDRLEELGVDVPKAAGVKELQKQLLMADSINPSIARLSPDLAEKAVAHWTDETAEEVVKYFRGLPREITETGLFDRSFYEDLSDYMEHMFYAMSGVGSARAFLGGPGVVMRAVDKAVPETHVPLKDAWEQSSLSNAGLRSFASDFAKKRGEQVADDGWGEYIGSLRVDPRGQKALTAYVESFNPRTVSKIRDVFDRLTAAYKSYLTLPWPSFHARNRLAGIWSAWAEGDLGVGGVIEAIRAPSRAIRGHDVPYLDEFLASGLMEGGSTRISDSIGTEAAEQIAQGVPEFLGGTKELLSPWRWGERGRHNLNPLRMRGVTDPDEVAALAARAEPFVQNVLGAGGEKMYNAVEFANRFGPYKVLRDRGFTPAQAIHKVKRSQFMYSETARSAFGREVMPRLVPFWGWTSRNVPYQIEKIFNSPGGRTAQTLRAMNVGSGGEFVPRFLREGLAVNAGETPEGETTFLKQAGLPVEDLNVMVMSGLSPTGRTFEKAASKLHPLVTAPWEYWAGRNLYFGRDIADLQGPTGSEFWDFALMNSPFSRFVNETWGLADERKTPVQRGLNFMTGLKSGTYDLPMHRQIELKEALQERMTKYPEARTFTRPYIPKSKRAEMDPEDVRGFKRDERVAQAIQAELAKLWKEREKGS